MKQQVNFLRVFSVKVFFVTVCFWIAKSAAFYNARHQLNFSAQLFLCLCIVFFGAVALNGFKFIFVSAKNHGYSTTRALGFVLLSYFLSELPFAPDMISFLYGINKALWPLAFGLLAVSVVVLLFIVRLPAVLLLNALENKFGTNGLKRVVTHFFALLVMYSCEALLLGLIPFVYVTSFGVPMIFSSRPTQPQQNADRVIVLVNPQISDDKRNALHFLGWNGLNEVAEAVVQTKLDTATHKYITYIFPETTLFASRHQVLQLYNLVSAQKPNSHISFVIGVREGSQNIVYGVERTELNGVSVWPIQIKSDLVPLVEGPLLGVYLGDKGSQTEANVSEAPTNWNGLKAFETQSKMLICYESLQPKKILANGPAVVLTNHSAFSRWKVTSQAYDTALRTLYGLSGRTLILVGNFGVSGVFLNRHNDFASTNFQVQLLGLSRINQ